MPIYAFECGKCGHQFERLQRLADADPTECPECHAEQVRRQLTAPSFRLAGAGWYETDFKKDGDKKRNLAEKAEPSAPASTAPTAPAAPASPATSKSEPASGPAKPKPESSKPAAVSTGKASAD
jgi:putative FmdB family regulatory protein